MVVDKGIKCIKKTNKTDYKEHFMSWNELFGLHYEFKMKGKIPTTS